MKNIVWFKEELEPSLKSFEIEYKFFEKGDFGDLTQVEFNSKEKGGGIDFWSTGWLSIFFVDYIKGDILLNVMLEPHEEKEKESALKRLQKLLQ